MRKTLYITIALGVTAFALYHFLKPKSSYVIVTKWGIKGNQEGWFDNPQDVTIDAAGTVYVADFQNHRVQKFTSEGRLLQVIGRYGHDPGEICYPRSIDVDAHENFYIYEQEQSRVEKFTSTGKFLLAFGKAGSGRGQFSGGGDLGAGGEQEVFVGGTWKQR